MSKPVKKLIVESYKERFEGVNGAVLVDLRGVGSNDNNRFRNDLAQKRIKVTVVKNSLARRAFDDSSLMPINEMLDGAVALVYPADGEASVVGIARELITWAKEIPEVTFKGALMEGITFGPEQIDALSKYPTKEEAQADVVQILLSPGQNLVGATLGPGRKIASILKSVREKLEAGETIAA